MKIMETSPSRRLEEMDEEEPQPTSSSRMFANRSNNNEGRSENVPEERNNVEPNVPAHSRYASQAISLIDMVWTGLEVFLVLIATIPSESLKWYVPLACLSPNVIQMSGAVMMYKKTKNVNGVKELRQYCQIWFILAVITILLHGAFITWTTISGIITKFLVFVLLLKLLWRFVALFFVNELHNELEESLSSWNYRMLENEDDHSEMN